MLKKISAEKRLSMSGLRVSLMTGGLMPGARSMCGVPGNQGETLRGDQFSR